MLTSCVDVTFPVELGIEGPHGILGKGVFGVVVKGIKNGKQKAVKILELDKENPNFEIMMAEIMKEANIMNKLGRCTEVIQLPSDSKSKSTIGREEDDKDMENESSQHIVRVYVIQPLIPGKPLTNYFEELESRAKAASEAKNELEQLNILIAYVDSFIAACTATLEIHNHGIIHGDLHSGNILYDDESKTAAVIDFGLSFELHGEEQAVYVIGDAEIHSYHRAPETVKARYLRKRSDLFSAELEPYSSDEELSVRLYVKSGDVYSLGVDCGVTSQFSDHAPEFVYREVTQLMHVFRDMTQEVLIGGNNNLEDRISLNSAIDRLQGIKAQLLVRVYQKSIYSVSPDEIKSKAAELGYSSWASNLMKFTCKNIAGSKKWMFWRKITSPTAPR